MTLSPAELARLQHEDAQADPSAIPTTSEMEAHMRAGRLVIARDAASGAWGPALVSLSDFTGDDAPDDPQPAFRLVDEPGPAWQMLTRTEGNR